MILETVSVLGKLINLEILNLVECEFEMLPMEIGGLKKLKQMYILNCNSLRRIAFGIIISGLTRLEELVIFHSFDGWEAKDGGEKDVACLSELNNLKNIITLKIEIKNSSAVPRQKPLWVQKVKKYGIIVSKGNLDIDDEYAQKFIILGKVVNPLGDWIYDMASDAEYLNLEGFNCMNVLKGLSKNFRNLSSLKYLRLSEFSNVRYLAEGLPKGAIFPTLESLYIADSVNLQQISDVSPPIGSFVALQRIIFYNLSGLICLWKVSVKEHLYLKNLRSVEIYQCRNLSYMFSLSVAQSLVQLFDLNVHSCENMKEIFKKDDGELLEINKIEFPNLNFLGFDNLKSFRDFCNGIDGIELPKLGFISLCNLSSMKMTKGDNNEVYQQYLIPKVAGMNLNLCALTDLLVEGIENFKCMFSPSVISGVPNLSNLEIRSCSMLEQVIGKDDEIVGETILLPMLVKVTLENLPNILTFCYNAIQMPSIEEVNISQCPQMLKFVEELPCHISNSRSFFNKQVQCPRLKSLILDNLKISAVFSSLSLKSLAVLEIMHITDCQELEHVITKEWLSTMNMEEEFIQMIPLKSLTLVKLPKLCGSIFPMKQHMEFPSLEIIKIEDCPMLEKFSLGSLHLPKLKRVHGLSNTGFASSFFFHNEMSSREIHSKNNCFIIPIKDISFNSNVDENNRFYLLAPASYSSESFLDAISLPFDKEIVGRFKTEKIRTGIEYEIMLMIWFQKHKRWFMLGEDSIVIELKLSGGSQLLQSTEILKNQAKEIWTEISIGKFMMRKPQQVSEELEFSLRQRNWELWDRILIKGVRIKEI